MDEINPEFALDRRRHGRRCKRNGESSGEVRSVRSDSRHADSGCLRPRSRLSSSSVRCVPDCRNRKRALFDPKTTLLFGDAKDTLTKVVSAVKNM